MIKPRRTRRAGHAARMGERRGVYIIFLRKREEKIPLRELKRTWEDNIKMDMKEMVCGGMDWI